MQRAKSSQRALTPTRQTQFITLHYTLFIRKKVWRRTRRAQSWGITKRWRLGTRTALRREVRWANTRRPQSPQEPSIRFTTDGSSTTILEEKAALTDNWLWSEFISWYIHDKFILFPNADLCVFYHQSYTLSHSCKVHKSIKANNHKVSWACSRVFRWLLRHCLQWPSRLRCWHFR